jgi:hypothetical protein
VTLPPPADPRAVRWRYHFTDFRLGRLITTLPMVGVKLDDVLNGAASGSGTVPLSGQVIARDPFSATVTRRSICWAERQILDAGQVIESTVPWAGLVMKRTRQYAGRAMKLDMITWPGYFERRLLRDWTFGQQDKFTIFRTLLADAVNQPAVAILIPGTPPTPAFYGHNSPQHALCPSTTPTTGPRVGVLSWRTDRIPVRGPRRPYLASDLKTTLSAINELAASGDGFDYRFIPYMATPGDLTTMRVRAEVGYPRLGRLTPPDLRWSTDPADRRQRWGFVEDLTITEDGSAVNNRITAVGSGTGPDQIRATADSTQILRNEQRAGYPLYEGTAGGASNDDRTYDTVYGKAYGALVSGFASEMQVTGIKIRGDLAPSVTSYALGDDVTVRVGDAVTGQPTTFVGQLVGRSIEPPERGGTEQVTLDVQGTVVG